MMLLVSRFKVVVPPPDHWIFLIQEPKHKDFTRERLQERICKERDTFLQAKRGTMKSTCFGKWNDGHKENWGTLEKALDVNHYTGALHWVPAMESR